MTDDNQEKAIEAERTAFQAQETHLNAKIRQLQSSSATMSITPLPSQELQADLGSLRVSHATLLAQLDALSSELHETRSDNVRLKEENEGWEYLVTERTLQGNLNLFHGLGGDEAEGEDGDEVDDGEGTRRRGTGQLEALDEELESEMDDLHGDLDAQSPILEDGPVLSRTSTLRIGAARRPGGRGVALPVSRQVSISGSLDVAQHTPGTDLAAELGRADQEGAVPAPSGEQAGEEIAKENKRLREEVKALQLYCSKVSGHLCRQLLHRLSGRRKTRQS